MRKKLKKILTVTYHYLLEGDNNGSRPRVWGHTPQKIFEIWNPEMPFPSCILSIQKIK